MNESDALNENLVLLQQALSLAEQLSVSFPNQTQLARFCTAFMSPRKEDGVQVSISTLTRNPIYRALLHKFLANQTGTNYELQALQARSECSNLRADNSRLRLYISTLESQEGELPEQLSRQPALSFNEDLAFLEKTIDLLIGFFSEHVEIDKSNNQIICPYRRSSDRVIVPSKIARYYISRKACLR